MFHNYWQFSFCINEFHATANAPPKRPVKPDEALRTVFSPRKWVTGLPSAYRSVTDYALMFFYGSKQSKCDDSRY
jgi:hypothetical protein